jgi:hypothetical protein
MNMGNLVIAVIDNSNIEMSKNIYEKGKLVEKSGRKATNLSFLGKRGYGSRVAMRKSASARLILLARNIESGGCHESSNIYFKKE